MAWSLKSFSNIRFLKGDSGKEEMVFLSLLEFLYLRDAMAYREDLG